MKTYASLAALALLFIAPTAFADTAFTAAPKTGTLPLSVVFNGPTPATQNMYTLNFGDGSTAATVNQWPVSHTYASAGSYTAKLYVQETALPVATAGITVTVPGGGTSCLTLENEFGQGDTDDDTNGEVSKLQAFLAQDPNIYPEGKVTGYFGALTVKAVQRFQAAHGISQTGYVGPKTRAALADCTNTGNPSITVTVSPSSLEQGNTAAISWKSMNVATNTAVSLRLLNSNGVRRGLIAVGRPASGTFSWTIPYGTGKPEDIINGIANCNAGGICTGTLAVGNYFIQAALYSPANAFEEEAQPTVVAVSNKAPLAVTAKEGSGPPPAEPSCSLSIQPASIALGQSATLVWYSSNATGGTISGIGPVAVSGSQTVSPKNSTVYIGTFTGKGGTTTCNASITVTGAAGPVTSLTAVPSTGTAPLPVLFTWVSSNATTIQFGDDRTESVAATGATSHTYSFAGTFTAKLLAGTSVLTTTTVTATDGGGGGGGGTSGDQYISVTPANGPAPLSVTATVALICGGGTPNPPYAQCEAVTLNWGDGTVETIPKESPGYAGSKVKQHTYASPGTYNITAVSNAFNYNYTGRATVVVTAGGGAGNNVTGCTPDNVTVTGPIPSPRSGSAPLAVKFTLSYPVSHAIDGVDFGDGTPILNLPVQNSCVIHTYASPGTYTAFFTLHGQRTGILGDTSIVTVTTAAGGACMDPCANHMCVISPPFKCDGTPPAGWCTFNGYAYPNGHAYIDGGVVMNPPRPRPPGNRCSNGTWIYDPNIPIAL